MENMSFEERFAESRPAFPLLISTRASLESGVWTLLLTLVVALCMWYSSKWWHQQQSFKLKDVMASLDILPEPVILMSHHTIVFVNNATLSTFGFDSKTELEGKHVGILMQQKEAAAHDSFVGRHEKTGQRRVIGKPRGERAYSVCGSQCAFVQGVGPAHPALLTASPHPH
jgi:hypothetical protein